MNQVVSHDAILIRGQAVNALPQDLYIPPDALRVFLETFQGPLDLLLYLIRKDNIDILDIPIKAVTEQYMQYVELMQELQLELAGEYLLMAAMLAEIKSRLLLPRPESSDEAEVGDPRAELIRRLQLYECYKKAAEDFRELKQMDWDVYQVQTTPPDMPLFTQVLPALPMQELLTAFAEVMTRARLFADHRIEKQLLSIRERMLIVMDKIQTADAFISFGDFFTVEEGRMGVVVTFIAILELIRQSVIEIVQHEPFGQIYVKAKQTQSSEAIEYAHT